MPRRMIVLLLVLWGGTTRAQVSGYTSASRGYSSNALYNYEGVGDRVTQAYLELAYAKPYRASRLQLGYTGGLMLFDGLSARDYYEHRIGGDYLVFGNRPPGDDDAGEGIRLGSDTTGSWTQLGVRASRRYDRDAYNDYDNFGIGGFAVVRNDIGPRGFTRWTMEIGYRNYKNVKELSNVTAGVTGHYVWNAGKGLDLGILGFGGVKHYLQETYDTTQFASAGQGSGSSSGGGHGQGKGGANGGGLNGKGGKDVLVNAGTENSYQIALGFTALTVWGSGSCEGAALYRLNPGGGSRYAAQVAGSTMLTEDLYNDHFSYAGPEITVVFRQRAPLEVQIGLSVGAGVRNYGGPALALDGTEQASVRQDLRGSIEATLSRYFEIGGGVGLELQLSGELLRNQSNDSYNDYSLGAFSLGLGVGF